MDPTIDLRMPTVDVPMATAVPCPPTTSNTTISSPKVGRSTVVGTNLTKATSWNDSPHLRADQVDRLRREQGFPGGLAAELGRTRAVYPLRFWVIDNSGTFGHSIPNFRSQFREGHSVHNMVCVRACVRACGLSTLFFARANTRNQRARSRSRSLCLFLFLLGSQSSIG